MNATGPHIMRNLNDSSDDRALALKMFSGTVKAVFPTAVKLWPTMMHKRITSGKSEQFPVLNEIDPSRHTTGVELGAEEEPATEERTIPVDDKEIVAHKYLGWDETQVLHYDLVRPVAEQIAMGMGRELETRGLRMVAKGARIDARTISNSTKTYKSGVLVRRNAADVATAYPQSYTGSRNIQSDLSAMAKKFNERNITINDNWRCYLNPYLWSVLLEDQSLQSTDFVADSGRRELRILRRIHGFEVVMSNLMPQDISNRYEASATAGVWTSGEPAYQGNFSKTAMLCTAAPDSLGCLSFGDISAEGPEWISSKRSWLSQSAWLGGCKWLRPEACGEVYVSTSPYTLSGGSYDPA